MKINIYQINHERDTHRVAFVDTKYLEKAQGASAIDSKIYDKVFSGNVDCKTLDDVYSRFNTDHPTGIVADRFQYRMWLRFWRMKVWKKAFISAIPTTSKRWILSRQKRRIQSVKI